MDPMFLQRPALVFDAVDAILMFKHCTASVYHQQQLQQQFNAYTAAHPNDPIGPAFWYALYSVDFSVGCESHAKQI